MERRVVPSQQQRLHRLRLEYGPWDAWADLVGHGNRALTGQTDEWGFRQWSNMSWFFFSFTRRLSCLFWFLECSDSQFFRLFADERMCFCYLILGIFSSKLRDPISIPWSKLMLTLLLRALSICWYSDGSFRTPTSISVYTQTAFSRGVKIICIPRVYLCTTNYSCIAFTSA